MPPEKLEKNIANDVLARVNKFQELGQLSLPENYAPENALKSAWLILVEAKTREGKPVLEACTRESIANSLLKMVVLGLQPMKKQCDFIPYADKLTLQLEYHGIIALAKRHGNVVDVVANVIYQDDDFKYTIDPKNGRTSITEHSQKIENIDKAKIKGAYATIIFADGSSKVEIMTMAQINQAWQQGATKGASPAHKNFPDQMCKKTVIARGCKLEISSSNDSALIRNVVDENDIDDTDVIADLSKKTITEKANTEVLSFEEVPAAKEKVEQPTTTEPVQEPVNGEAQQQSTTGGPTF